MAARQLGGDIYSIVQIIRGCKDAKGRRPGNPAYDPRTLSLPPQFLKNLTGGQRQWWEFKSQHIDKVLFFKMGKFYELYEMDAHVGAKELDLQYMKRRRNTVPSSRGSPCQAAETRPSSMTYPSGSLSKRSLSDCHPRTSSVAAPSASNAGVGQQRLCPVLRSYGCRNLQASLDGFLIVSHGDPTTEFFICNPVTRKCAPLGKPQSHQGFHNYIAGFYLHQPSGEYRVLWGSQARSYDAEDTNCRTFYYVIAVGSNDTRCVAEGCIPKPTASSPSLDLALRGGLESSYRIPPIHHRGSLHWRLGKYHGCDASYIMVFNTAAETFRLICQPAQLSSPNLLFLEMDGSLALCSFSNDKDTIDVWVVQDYDTGTWSFKHRINLSGVDPILPSDIKLTICPRMVVLNEGELLIQFAPRRVLRYDMAGKFLGYVKDKGSQEVNLWITKHYLQESVIPLPLLLEVREEDEPPFFTGL